MTFLLALFLHTPPKPQLPQGWLDCYFTKDNIYRCKP